MIKLSQRQINHGVFGLLTGMIGADLVTILLDRKFIDVLALAAITLIICAALWAAYWRGWEYARHTLVVLITAVAAFGMPAESMQQHFSHAIYIAPILALVLAGPVWVLGSAAVILVIFGVRANGGPYLIPSELMSFAIITGGMVLSRLAVDNTQRLEASRREAEAERARTEAERARAEQKSSELEQRNADQQHLLDLVATLETPTIRLGRGCCSRRSSVRSIPAAPRR
jgi:hypothetical protein